MPSVRRIASIAAVALVVTACSAGPTGDGAGSTTAPSILGSEQDPAEARAGDGGGSTGDGAAGDGNAEERSYAGDVAAPEFPTGLDWLNTTNPLTLAELRGKVVLLDFWTYGCINCIHIIPDLERLEAEYSEELVVIGVHSAKFTNESATENIRQVILRYGVDHPVVNDRDFEVWRSWGAQAWPTIVLIDPAGNVVGGHAGEGVYDIVAPVIASLVAEFDAAGGLDRRPLELATEASRQPSRILSFPGKVHLAPDDTRLFIADTGHHRIVVADRLTGNVLAVYGSGRAGFADGTGTAAAFDAPQGMALAGDGTTLYVADTNNHAIRAVDTATGAVSTYLGTGRLGWPPTGGIAPDVDLNSPWHVLIGGTRLYIAMAGHHQIWSVDLESDIAVPLVGSAREGVRNGPLDEAELAQPSGMVIDDRGRLYFADSESSSIRYADVELPTGETGLVAGGATSLFEFGDADGVGQEARLQHPLGVVIWEPEGDLIVADTYNSRLRRINPTTREVTTFLGGEQGWADGNEPRFYEPGGLAIAGDTLYVADTNNHAVRVVDLPSGETTTLVLKGIEAFEPRPDDADYRGTIVTLDPVTVAPGPGEIVLDLGLPPGYKLNDDAPSSLVLGAGGVARFAGGGAADLTGRQVPARLPADFLSSGELVADLTAVYCQETAQSLCLIEQVRFRVTVALDESAGNALALPYGIALPFEVGG